MDDLIKRLRNFAEERDWDQFHNPKNLTMALGGEVGELMEIFQWKSTDDLQIRGFFSRFNSVLPKNKQILNIQLFHF